jgi:hypothetical protein
MSEMRIAYTVLVGKCKEKGPLGRPRCRWWDNIIVDFIEIGWEVVDWFYLAQNRDPWWAFVNTIMNVRVP